MAKMTFGIMGATGHVGHYLTEELLKKGHTVRALGRNASKLKELKDKGAQTLSGNFSDTHLLANLFKGCNAVFSFIPPSYFGNETEDEQDSIGEAIAHTIGKVKVPYLVNLSSIGANLQIDTGPIKALHRQEERLNTLENLNVVHFRPDFFMENVLMSVKNGVSSAIHADLPISMVATRDIGMKIAEWMQALKFKGSSVFDFVGPKEVTMTEAVRVLGKAMGKPDLKYKVISYEQMEKNLIASGMKHHTAKLMVELQRAFNEKRIIPTQKLTAEHRGKTTIEEFAKSIAPTQRRAA